MWLINGNYLCCCPCICCYCEVQRCTIFIKREMIFLLNPQTTYVCTTLTMLREDSFAAGFPVSQGSLRSEFSHENPSVRTSLLLNSISSPSSPNSSRVLKACGDHFWLLLLPLGIVAYLRWTKCYYFPVFGGYFVTIKVMCHAVSFFSWLLLGVAHAIVVSCNPCMKKWGQKCAISKF